MGLKELLKICFCSLIFGAFLPFVTFSKTVETVFTCGTLISRIAEYPRASDEQKAEILNWSRSAVNESAKAGEKAGLLKLLDEAAKNPRTLFFYTSNTKSSRSGDLLKNDAANFLYRMAYDELPPEITVREKKSADVSKPATADIADKPPVITTPAPAVAIGPARTKLNRMIQLQSILGIPALIWDVSSILNLPHISSFSLGVAALTTSSYLLFKLLLVPHQRERAFKEDGVIVPKAKSMSDSIQQLETKKNEAFNRMAFTENQSPEQKWARETQPLTQGSAPEFPEIFVTLARAERTASMAWPSEWAEKEKVYFRLMILLGKSPHNDSTAVSVIAVPE
ncbi:MAG: hypothetical protein JWQ35_2790 [Bacteriovoracaceae bacterium]|nr:hypothetical protein [Bacteriovoracaceae bacterium]